MAEETHNNSASTQTQNSGETNNNAMVGWRDAYNTLGELDLELFNTDATSGSSTGAITIGDVYSGKTNQQVGLFKIFMIVAAGFVGFYFYKRYLK